MRNRRSSPFDSGDGRKKVKLALEPFRLDGLTSLCCQFGVLSRKGFHCLPAVPIQCCGHRTNSRPKSWTSPSTRVSHCNAQSTPREYGLENNRLNVSSLLLPMQSTPLWPRGSRISSRVSSSQSARRQCGHRRHGKMNIEIQQPRGLCTGLLPMHSTLLNHELQND